MAIDLDDEIMQDFLVEAGEILEKLNGQLVELEQTPDNYDLLNAIFRGFHTIKGGAGFLNLTALIEICHRAEDVFNALRQGVRQIDAALMDVVLEVLDVVNTMFQDIASGKDPVPADPELLNRIEAQAQAPSSQSEPDDLPPEREEEEEEEEKIEALHAASEEMPLLPEEEPESPPPIAQPSGRSVVEEIFTQMLEPNEDVTDQQIILARELANPQPGSSMDDITEEEFERLLDELHGANKHTTSSKPPPKAVDADITLNVASTLVGPDEITEEEFESLLDNLHGKGKHGGLPSESSTPPPPPASPESESVTVKPPHKSASDEITEDEFESLLDSLHGKGKHGGSPMEIPPPPESTEAAAMPVASVAPPAVKKTPAALASRPSSASKADTNETYRDFTPRSPRQTTASPAAETTVRVDTQRLDEIMNLVGELVLVRNRFQTLRIALNDEEIAKAVANLDVVTSDLQLSVMKTRMQPIKKVFGRFPRVVRDLARSINKEVQLELRGEDTDLDKNLVEALADPLVHLVRNAVDHGIETPDERLMYGKPQQGVVILTAAQEGNHIELTIEDDGRGMDPVILKRKAVEKGLMDQESASRMDDKEAFNLIFMPGFSTKTEISDVSGRGVGMDVVKTRIAQMNGSVAIDSVRGKGSKISIKLPLTLAIMPTLMVKLNEQPFALPLASVVEILDLDLNKTNNVDGQLVVMVRQRALPLFYLKEWLIPGFHHQKSGDEYIGHVVIVHTSGRHVGFVVDHLVGQEEVVIKPLGAKLQGVAGMAGATITGDGKIALILDVPGLMKRYAP